MGVRERQIDHWGVRDLQQCCQQSIPADSFLSISHYSLTPCSIWKTVSNQCMIYVCVGPIHKLHFNFILFSFISSARPSQRSSCSGHTTDLFAEDTRQFGCGQTSNYRRLGQNVDIEPASAGNVALGRAVDQLGSLSAQLRLDGRSRVAQLH